MPPELLICLTAAWAPASYCAPKIEPEPVIMLLRPSTIGEELVDEATPVTASVSPTSPATQNMPASTRSDRPWGVSIYAPRVGRNAIWSDQPTAYGERNTIEEGRSTCIRPSLNRI